MWAGVAAAESSVRPAGIEVHIESRAPTPMRDARVTARLDSGQEAVALVGDIPPCIALAFRIVPPDDRRVQVHDLQTVLAAITAICCCRSKRSTI